MKMLYKVEENLKQNNQKPQHGKTPLWWTKSKDTICPSKIPVSLRLSLSPKKRLEHQKNKQNPAVNPPHRTPPNLLSASPIFKVFAQIDLEEYLFHLTRFCYDKVIRGCCKTVSSSIVIRNGKV